MFQQMLNSCPSTSLIDFSLLRFSKAFRNSAIFSKILLVTFTRFINLKLQDTIFTV